MSDGNGALPDGWAYAKLNELAALQPNSMTDGPFGSKLKTSHYVDSGIRVIRLGNIGVGQFVDSVKAFITPQHFETIRKHEAFAGDLVIAALAEPVGRACAVPEYVGPAVVKADCIRFKPHETISSQFLMNWLNSPVATKNAEEMCHGIGRLRINMANMRELPTPVAPLPEQRRIVSKIESLQERSARARGALGEVGPLLEQFRQSVLRAAFSGRLTADWRAKNHLPAPKVGRWWVYAIECEDDSIYIGMTDNIPNRWKQHREGKGASWTKRHKPRYVIHWEELDSREAAANREKELKTGYGRKWLKRERKAGRLRQAGDVEPASELLNRIRIERRHRWEEAELAKYEAKGKSPPKNWREKFHNAGKKAVRATVADVRAEGVAIDEVPDGWELVRLGDIVNLQAGYAFKSKWFSETGVKLLRGTNIEPGKTRWIDTVHLPAGRVDGYAEYLLNAGDVVIAMDRPVISTGLKVARLNETDLPALLLQRVGRFRIEDRISPKFVYQFVQSPFFLRHIGVQATGTQLPHISANDIESAILPLPPIDEQAAITARISRVLDTITELNTVTSNVESALTQLDQSILAKAFRGELVRQDPRDEPASELLKRIRAAREERPKDKKTRARKRGVPKKSAAS